MATAIDPALRARLLEAARAFNSGRYFESHEELEEALDDVPDDLWDLFVGLIQIAVGYHKVTQRLWRGAAGMLQRGIEKVAPFPESAGGVLLEPLRRRVRDDIDALRGSRFDAAAFAAKPPRLQLEARRTRAAKGGRASR
jgi:predicted metal-dependent hydrolase